MYCNTSSNLWGERPRVQETDWEKIVPKDLGKLVILSAIKPELPKPYHPVPDESCNKLSDVPKECSEMEPTVLDTIKLLQHSKKIQELIDIATSEEEDNVQEKIKDWPPFPELSEKKVKVKTEQRMYTVLQQHELSPFAAGKPVEMQKLPADVIKQILKKCVATIIAHAGYDTAMESAFNTLTDVAEDYLQKFTMHLRYTVDDEMLLGPTPFIDAMEHVYHKMGIGSITALQEFYQTRVIDYKEKVHNECLKLIGKYQLSCALLQVQGPLDDSRFNQEGISDVCDLSEIQFPGENEDNGLDDLQPSLQTEY